MKVILIALVVLCCCCTVGSSVAVGLVGKFESNGQCLYKGPLSQEKCGNNPVNVDKSGFKRFDNSKYTFQYPTEWFLKDDSKSQQVFIKDPSITKEGNDNIYTSIIDKEIDNITQTNCDAYSNSLAKGLMDASSINSYDKADVTETKVNEINGYKNCRIVINAEIYNSNILKTVEITQIYNIMENPKDSTKNYFILITVIKDSKNLQKLEEIASTFFVK